LKCELGSAPHGGLLPSGFAALPALGLAAPPSEALSARALGLRGPGRLPRARLEKKGSFLWLF